MKNIRKFEMLTEKMEAIIEEYSISYVNEENKVYTTPENGGQGGDTVKNYMRFVAVEDSVIKLNAMDNDTWEYVEPTVNLMVNKNNEGWTEWDFTPISLTAGETLYLKGDNQNGFSIVDLGNGTGVFYSFSKILKDGNGSTGKFECHGNIMSLLYGDNFEDKTTIPSVGCFKHLFYLCDGLFTAPELPATTLAHNCYENMFYGCTSLIEAPELPATTLAKCCYQDMFDKCTSLTKAPELPATTLATSCYQHMFSGCTSLTTAPELPATTLADHCYKYMFARCANLTTAPVLPATKMTTMCYYYMFSGCTSLNHITMLATNISAYYCLERWLSGVSLTGTFVKHPDMNSLPVGISGIPNGWTVEDYMFTWTECTNLTITADDVIGNQTSTTVYYTATVNGIDYKGNTVTGVILTGTSISAEFPQNTSETETVERTITFEFMGVTASTTITQGTWVQQSYTIDLNNQWELSSTISNPDSTLYDGVYQSFSNKGVDSSSALMYIDIFGYSSFKFYVRSYAESNYDYLVVSNLDSTLTSGTTSGSDVKMTTKGNQNSGTIIDSYQLVEFTGIDSGKHRITVMYRKDTSSNSGDDRGYVLIPKNQ